MDISKKFFLQPEELKRPYSRKSFAISPNHGWVSMETERYNQNMNTTVFAQFTVLLNVNNCFSG